MSYYAKAENTETGASQVLTMVEFSHKHEAEAFAKEIEDTYCTPVARMKVVTEACKKVKVNVNGFTANREYVAILLDNTKSLHTERNFIDETRERGCGDIIRITRLSTGDFRVVPEYMAEPQETYNFLTGLMFKEV